ncbi:MAG: serine/threonine-protein kinase [Gemmataceae bacterium]
MDRDQTLRAGLGALQNGNIDPVRFSAALLEHVATTEASLDQSLASFLPPPPQASAPTEVEKFRGLFEPPSVETPSAVPAERYQRLTKHATGGLGQIWIARDNHIGRDVALKELKQETVQHGSLRRRFVEEARITGRLEHPGIVPVYELVQSATQPPYYVMRFIKGRTLAQAIKTYHEAARQNRSDRLALTGLLQAFLAVCQALAYAHAQGIIHRDLKGQNVILGDFGEVIVLDWGLAKQMGTPAEEATGATPTAAVAAAPSSPGDTPTSLTRAGEIMGTPAYMAPEQAAGKQDLIDARTDVYGLGAMLYEILTGAPPFRLADPRFDSPQATMRDSALKDFLRRVQQETPRPPRELRPSTPRALEAVCLKALSKEPAGRYASAAELAQEIQRYLADEPVAACRERWWQRAARWGRRHRTAVVAAVAVLVAAVVGLSVTAVLLGREQARTEAAALRAEENLRRARAVVDDFFVRVSEKHLLNAPGMQTVRADLLKKAKAYYQDFVTAQRDAPEVEGDLAKTLYRLASISSDLGEGKDAVGFADQAVDAYERLVAKEASPANRRGLGKAVMRRAAVLYKNFKKNAEAEKGYESARAMLADLHKTQPDDMDATRSLAIALGDLGNLYLDRRALAEARAAFEHAVDLFESLRPRQDDEPELLDDIAVAQTNLGNAFWLGKALPEARKRYEQALAIHEKLVEMRPDVVDYREHLAGSHDSVGNALGGGPAALAHYRKAIEIRTRLAECNPGVPRFRVSLADSLLNIGLVFYQRVEAARLKKDAVALAEAFAASEEAIGKGQKIYQELADKAPENPAYAGSAGAFLAALGDLYAEKEPAAALAYYAKAQPWLEKAVARGQRTPFILNYLRNSYWGPASFDSERRRWASAFRLWHKTMTVQPPGKAVLAEWEGALRAAAKDGFFAGKEGRAALEAFADIPEARASAAYQEVRKGAAAPPPGR